MTIRFRTPAQISAIETKTKLLRENLLQQGRLEKISTMEQLNRLQDIESRIRKQSTDLESIANKLREHRANIKLKEKKPAAPKATKNVVDFNAKVKALEEEVAKLKSQVPTERVKMIG